MARPKYAQKVDSNHSEVVDWLSVHGCDVVDCSRAGEVPDLLVKYPRSKTTGALIGWIEVKVPTKREVKFTHAQLLWMASTSFAVTIVNTKELALVFAQTHQGMFTAQEKANLAVFCDGADKNKLYTVDQVQRAMQGIR